MQPRPPRSRLLEVVVVLAGILVAGYAIHVVRTVCSSPPGGGATTVTQKVPEARPSKATARAKPAPIEPVARAVARARTIVVIGDESGDDAGEWVDLWARDLSGWVNLHLWDASAQQFGTVASYGSGRRVDVWNLSYPSAVADHADRLDTIPREPGAVILSFGHGRNQQALSRALTSTSDAVRGRWGQVPTAWVLQNPATGQEARAQKRAVDHVRSLALTKRVPVIDVRSAFNKAASLEDLLGNRSLPIGAGSQLWAETVNRSLVR